MTGSPLTSTGKPSTLVAGSKDYKELLVDYVKAGFDVTAESTEGTNPEDADETVRPTLGQGRLKLDDHQTMMAFEIRDMPEELNRLAFRFSYMFSNETQNNIVRLIEADRQKRYILNESNDFSAEDIGFFTAD